MSALARHAPKEERERTRRREDAKYDPPMPWVERVSSFIEQGLGVSSDTASRLVSSVVIVGGIFFVRRVSRLVVARGFTDTSTRYQVNRGIAYLLGGLSVLLLLKLWTDGLAGIPTYLGLASAGLAIALQDPLTNLAGWLFIVIRRPFAVGERIQIGAHVGDVVDIRIFRFIMLEIGNWVHGDQSTGRVLHIPNGWIFKNPVASYDEPFGYIWNELELLVTFESNWRRAKEVITQTANEHAKKLSSDAQERMEAAADAYHIKFSKLTPVVWTSMADSGVRLTLRYLCKPRERRSSASEMWESVLGALEPLDDVALAYPTVRYVDEPKEGKRSVT